MKLLNLFGNTFLGFSAFITCSSFAGVLDSSRYYIQDIRVETDLGHGQPYQIYANGKMQAPVYVKIKAIDSETRKPVVIPNDELISATYLFDKQTGINLTYKNYFSNEHDANWIYSATQNQYQHTVPRSAGYAVSAVNSTSISVYRNRHIGQGWSQLTYWVSSKETHYSKNICVEIAMNDGNNINSCDTLYDEFATLNAIDALHYRADDFTFSFHYLKKTDSWYVGYWQLTPKNKQIKLFGLEWETPLQEGSNFFRAMDYFRPAGGHLSLTGGNTTAKSLILYPYKPSVEPRTIRDYVRIWNIEGNQREDYSYDLELSTDNLKFIQGQGSYSDYTVCVYVTKNICSRVKKDGNYVNTTSNDSYLYNLRPKFRVYDQFGNVARLKLVDSNTVDSLGWDDYQIANDE
ncbi:hypothetical protein [Zooshikella ganghwensis]|uniref:hypothetical protein n=1 Tax=Zooshikella ganghwensis TaxID=202772 RepID=UPI000427BFEA|nr:hypothetical protein [Zooshikella ganghwensis]